MCTHQERISKKLEVIGKQVDELTTSSGMFVFCRCGKALDYLYQFRCLYCLEVYCKECAEHHFGKTRDEYKNSYDNNNPSPEYGE